MTILVSAMGGVTILGSLEGGSPGILGRRLTTQDPQRMPAFHWSLAENSKGVPNSSDDPVTSIPPLKIPGRSPPYLWGIPEWSSHMMHSVMVVPCWRSWDSQPPLAVLWWISGQSSARWRSWNGRHLLLQPWQGECGLIIMRKYIEMTIVRDFGDSFWKLYFVCVVRWAPGTGRGIGAPSPHHLYFGVVCSMQWILESHQNWFILWMFREISVLLCLYLYDFIYSVQI